MKFIGQGTSLNSAVFRRVRKFAKSDYQLRHVCSSVCPHGKLGSPFTDFNSILYLSTFRKYVEKIQGRLKSEKNNGYFTRTPNYIYDSVSLNACQNEKCFAHKLQGNKRQICTLNNLYSQLKFVKDFLIRGSYSHLALISFIQLETYFTILCAMRKVAK